MFTSIRHLALGGCCALAFGLSLSGDALAGSGYGGPYGFGSPASDADIAKIDIDVMPDGRGAPPGQGSYAEGQKVYEERCLACHGEDLGSPVKGTGADALAGGRDSLASESPKKTVESYWPYASTLFDFTKRAMPFDSPGSLSDNEVYAVVAYILAEGKVIDKDTVMDAKAIADLKMPNHDGFIADPRPDVFDYE